MTHEEYLTMCDERDRLEKQIAEYEKHCTHGCIRIISNKMGSQHSKDGFAIQFDEWLCVNHKLGRKKPKWKTIFNSTDKNDLLMVLEALIKDIPAAYDAFCGKHTESNI